MTGYQIRHKEWGVFQGEFLGLGFWHPTSEQPEQGFCRFPTIQEAEGYVVFMCRGGRHQADDFTVETFDEATSKRLQSVLALAT